MKDMIQIANLAIIAGKFRSEMINDRLYGHVINYCLLLTKRGHLHGTSK